MKYQFQHSMMGSGFKACFENKIDKIEISEVKDIGGHSTKHYSAEEFIRCILREYIPLYSKINPDYKEGRKKLADHLRKENQILQHRIEKNKLLIQMCRKQKFEKTDANDRP